MGTRTRRVCNRCRRSVPPGPCTNCTRRGRADADRDRPTAAQRGYDRRWQRTRRDYLDAHPFCECDEHADAEVKPLAVEVHHKDGLGPLGPHGHDWGNLQALTHACHSRITMHEQGWHAPPAT